MHFVLTRSKNSEITDWALITSEKPMASLRDQLCCVIWELLVVSFAPFLFRGSKCCLWQISSSRPVLVISTFYTLLFFDRCLQRECRCMKTGHCTFEVGHVPIFAHPLGHWLVAALSGFALSCETTEEHYVSTSNGSLHLNCSHIYLSSDPDRRMQLNMYASN